MKAKFTWRATSQYCTLLSWSGVLLKAELPFEYVNGPGAKFWYVPPVVDNKVAYGDHIKLDHAPAHLVVGSVVLREDYDMMIRYLQNAGERLSEIKKEVDEGEVLVVQV